MKRPHPSEVAGDAQAVDAIRNATYFRASVFVGRGTYITADAITVRGALEKALLLEADERAYTRRALIYAVSPEGHQTLIRQELIDKLRRLSCL